MSKIKLITGLIAALSCGTSALAQANLTAETAAPVTVPGNTVLGLADLASAAGVADIQVAPGQTLTNSVQNVAEGKTDIGAAPFLLPFLLSRGAGPYASLGPDQGAELAGKLAVLYTYRFAVYGMTAYESKGFGGYDAIEGATIYNGPPRGAALNRARALVRLATGMDEGDGYTGIQVNWGQAVATMTDGSADAHILPLNFPDGRHAQAASSGAMVAYSFPLKAFESEPGVNYGKAPGTAAVTQPITDDLFGSGIKVLSEDGNFRGYADVGGEVVNVAMSDDIAYGLTKAHIEGLDALGARAPMMPTAWLGEMDTAKTGMCGPNPMKYHPGAVRAWEEAGYAIPDCAKP